MFEPNTIAFQSLIVLVAPNFLGLSATGENGFMWPLTPMLHGAGIFTSKIRPKFPSYLRQHSPWSIWDSYIPANQKVSPHSYVYMLLYAHRLVGEIPLNAIKSHIIPLNCCWIQIRSPHRRKEAANAAGVPWTDFALQNMEIAPRKSGSWNFEIQISSRIWGFL